MEVDVVIIGAGAAGMMCALTAAQRGRSILLLDHAASPAEKIRISGGGRCNFTNLNAGPENYLSQNPHFCRSALARFTPQRFIAMLERHGIGYHEKTLGQLFCDDGSEAVIAMLRQECEAAGVRWCMPCKVGEISLLPSLRGKAGMGVKPVDENNNSTPSLTLPLQGGGDISGLSGFSLSTSRGAFNAKSLVIASGGLSIPKSGATPFGYRVAEQFGIPVVKLKPGLVPLSFPPEDWKSWAGLTGISLDVVVRCGKRSFREYMLFTHRGLSGPAILQISSWWEHGEPLHIDLLPDHDMQELLVQHHGSRMLLSNFLGQYLPKRFADAWCAGQGEDKPLNQYSAKDLAVFADSLHDWQLAPSGTLGYGKAEVTCGGVDTRALSSKTMECNSVSGLYFIGEVVDVTGQLGGYNFQWAWASGHAAGLAV